MIPLAEQLRPLTLKDVTGQDHLFGEKGWLSLTISSGRPLSFILWGPPGSGKTTIARLYAKAFDRPFVFFSAVKDSTSEIRKVIEDRTKNPLFSQQPILFVDEIHRFNKAQQDLFLPLVENGTIVLIGATTENPSISLNNALISRLRILELKCLSEKALRNILSRYEEKYPPLPLTEEAKNHLLLASGGDGRALLNAIENLQNLPSSPLLKPEELPSLIQKKPALYDAHGDGHYNLISALHKCVRGSDPDAALYYLARMLDGGESPHFIARRIVRMATEDIGLADPQALEIALQAWQAYEKLGSPEGELALAQAIVYLALAPKSNAIYTAFKRAKEYAKSSSHLSPPKTILNAPTATMKELGYGKGYQYDHDLRHSFSGQHYFPDDLPREQFYTPRQAGFEREMHKRREYFDKLREEIKLNSN